MKAEVLRYFRQDSVQRSDFVFTSCHKIEKTGAVPPFQSGFALVHTASTRSAIAPGSPSQEAFRTGRSARSQSVGQPFRHWFLQGTQWFIAGWSSPVARQAHNLKVASSNLAPATRQQALENASFSRAFCCSQSDSKFRSWKRREAAEGKSRVSAAAIEGTAR